MCIFERGPRAEGDDTGLKTRIHLVLDQIEKERFRRQAKMEGKSLSAWLRDLARERLAREDRVRLDTREELDAFFEACDERESGEEPDWSEQRAVIENSIRRGAADS